METIHPAYDVVSKRWFCEEFNVDAPTIRDLIKAIKVPVKVRDYYPDGMSATLGGLRIENEMRRARATYQHPPVPGLGNSEVTRKAGDLDAAGRPKWKQELHNGKAKHAKPLVDTSAIKVPEPSARGHMRALRGSDVYNAALDMWAAGATGPEISARFGKPPTWCGTSIIAAARKCGDPRAVVRDPNNYGKSRNKKKDI